MSDAMTEIARDNRRGEMYGGFLEMLIRHLEVPNDDNRRRLIERAASTDEVRGGYFGSPTDLSTGLEETLQKLVEKDRQAWANLLYRIGKSDFGAEFKRLQKLSPFADQVFIIVDYGMGFVNFYGDLKPMMAGFVREKGWKVGDCDKYVVILPEIPKPSDVIWVDCGIGGVYGPRPSNSW